MIIFRSPRFNKDFFVLSLEIQKKVDKQLLFLVSDIRHPSLRAKKYDEADGVWQARVDDHYRFYFQINAGTYVILRVKPHTD